MHKGQIGLPACSLRLSSAVHILCRSAPGSGHILRTIREQAVYPTQSPKVRSGTPHTLASLYKYSFLLIVQNGFTYRQNLAEDRDAGARAVASFFHHNDKSQRIRFILDKARKRGVRL